METYKDISQTEKFRNIFLKYKIHFILFWIIVYIAMALRQSENMFLPVVLISNLTFLTGTSIYACFVMFFLLPKFGYNKKVFQFFIYSLFGLCIAAIMNAFTDHQVYLTYAEHPVRSGISYLIPTELFMIFLISASFGSIKIADDYLSSKWKNEKLQKESLAAELKFLKSQLHLIFCLIR